MSEITKKCKYVLDINNPETWGGKDGDKCHISTQYLNEDGTWRCPYDTEEGKSKCIFHQPVEQKNDDEVIERFIKIIQETARQDSSDPQRIEFIGAKFGDFDLSGDIPDDIFEGQMLGMQYSHFDGKVNFSNIIFGDDTKFTGAHFSYNTSFKNAEFGHQTFFIGAKFSDETFFKHVEFGDETNFRGAEFGDVIYFTGAEFGYEADFALTDFGNKAIFKQVEFGARSDIRKAEFGDEANFQSVEFGQETDFSEAKFGNDASFFDAVFGDETDLTEVIFSDKTDFTGATFGDKIDMVGIEFGDETTFQLATFGNETDFTEAKFGNRTYFTTKYDEDTNFYKNKFDVEIPLMGDFNNKSSSATKFGDATVFKKAKFGIGTSFSETEFGDDTNFNFTQFGNETDFSGSEFGEETEFCNTKFGNETDFSNSEFGHNTKFKLAEFGNGTEFKRVKFNGETKFVNTTFGKDTDFSATEFKNSVSFSKTDFGSNASFIDCVFNGGISFKKAELTDSVLSGLQLHNANFEQALMSRSTLLGTDLRGAKLNGAVLGDVRINEDTLFLGHPNDATNSSPHTIDAIRSINRCVYDPKYGENNDETDVNKAKSVYRSLEELAGRAAQTRLQSQCFVRRQDLQKDIYRKAAMERESFQQILISSARYVRAKTARVTLLYGESPWRIIGISVGFILTIGLVYPYFGWLSPHGADSSPITWTRILNGEPYLLLESIYFSALTFTTLGLGDYVPVGGGGQALATLNTAFGAILIALLVFVLGRRAAR